MTPGRQRRRLLGASLLGGAAALLPRAARAAAPERDAMLPLQAVEPMARLHVAGDGALFGLSGSGSLWQFDGGTWRRIGGGLDPSAPLASGHGRVVGRGRGGGLWVFESGRVAVQRSPVLAPQAGLCVLAFGVIAVAAAADGRCHAVRLEPTSAGWRETARSADELLPDARPLQFDPDGSSADDNGHVVVFGSPDAERYRHGVLGDAVEPRALLLLERHGLETMARLDLPAPWVFEDIAPRPIAWRGRRALLTVRAGPQGAQLAVAALAEGHRDRFELAALGEPIGQRHRWLSPSSDGMRLGERELDVSAWAGNHWVVPTQDRRSLRIFELGSGAGALRYRDVPLAQPAAELRRWRRQGEDGVAVRLRDGSVGWLPLRA